VQKQHGRAAKSRKEMTRRMMMKAVLQLEKSTLNPKEMKIGY
jgi:hypothetical protein